MEIPDEPRPSQARLGGPAEIPSDLAAIERVLNPILVPLGFAPAQVGATSTTGQAIFCRGMVEGIDDGCVDLVLDLEAAPHWRISDVRYWGFPSDRWHLPFDTAAELPTQLRGLADSLPHQL